MHDGLWPRWRKTLHNLAAAVCGVIVACMAMEMLLQLFDPNVAFKYYNDPDTGLLIHRPNSSYPVVTACFNNTAHFNNAGFHGKNVTVEKPKGTYRIAIFGNSYVEAEQVPIEQTFYYHLEEKLNLRAPTSVHYEVIPFGVASNGTYLNALLLANIAGKYRPDLVVDVYVGGDYARNVPESRTAPTFKPDGTIELHPTLSNASFLSMGIKNLARQSKLLNHMNRVYWIAKTETDAWKNLIRLWLSDIEKNDNEEQTEARFSDDLWQTEEKAALAMHELAGRNQAKLMLVGWMRETPGRYAEEQKRLALFTAANGIDYLDLTPILYAKKDASGEDFTNAPCDEHWSVAGHAWAAEALYEALVQQPELSMTPK